MYRIRLVSGDEAAFGSIDELTAAVAAGTVTDKAEIFHARAEKWLPIASHPHFKLAKDRVAQSGGGVRSTVRPTQPALNGSGQRPAVGASGPRPATGPRPAAPQSGQRPANGAAGSRPVPALPDGAVASALKAARQAPLRQRTAPRAPASMPAPAAPDLNEFELLRADPALDAASSPARALPGIQLEKSPTIQPPQVVEPAPGVAHFVEQAPAQVELVSDEQAPAPDSARVEIINPDRVMPVVQADVQPMARVDVKPALHAQGVRDVPSMEIPVPVHDFAPPAEQTSGLPGPRRSRTPIFIGIGIAAAAVIGAAAFFLGKPSGEKPPAVVATPKPPEPAAGRPDSGGAYTTSAGASGSANPQELLPETRTARNDDGSSRARKEDGDASGRSDGLEPPPQVVLPAAPQVKGIADAAVLPTVDAGNPGFVDKQKALEQTVREIDSSMRRESGKSGGSTR